MTARVLFACTVLTAIVGFAVERRGTAQTGLKVTYGDGGLQQLSYQGVVLEDTQSSPADAFHIWHMKMTDLKGAVLQGGQYGWGETNNGRTWNASDQSWTYRFTWGSLKLQYKQQGDRLDLLVTETNSAGSGVILQGAEMFPLALHFPALPAGFTDASYPQLSYNTTAPGVTAADYGKGMVTAVVPDAQKPLYSGYMPTGQTNAYTALVSSTAPDGLATFQPHNDRPVLPGQTDQFTVSLRFSPSGTPLASLAGDAYQSWSKTWPMQLHWTDRRIIGTAYLASSPTGNVNQAGGYPNNPRRYFNDSQSSDFDVTTPAGLVKFQQRVLDGATSTVQNLRRLNAQGLITWDIEGEQFPQDTSYVCAPDLIATVAPEMESTVQIAGSPYAGMKLDDAYFKTIRDAGFRVGVCVRPQHFTLNADGTAAQVYLPDSQIAAELIRKMQYAHDRWGATLFYADSTVEQNGAVLDASIFQQAAAALPDSLIIPEETTPKYYAYTAAFKSFLFHGDLGTDSTVLNYYPRAFSANLINDVGADKLAAAMPALTASVRQGDVLMVHADYWQDNNATVQRIYAAAGVAGTTSASETATTPIDTSASAASGATSTDASTASTAPVATTDPASNQTSVPVQTTTAPSTPVISTPAVTTPVSPAASSNDVTILSPSAGANVAGSIQVQAQVNVTLDAAGSYLMVDGMEIGTRHVADNPYVYALDTTTLSNGTHTLQVWAHTTANSTVLSPTIQLQVANGTMASDAAPNATGATAQPSSSAAASEPVQAATPLSTPVVANANSTATTGLSGPVQLVYPVSGQAISGAVTVLATIEPGLDAAGSYLMVDGQPVGWQRLTAPPYAYALDTSTLSAGSHTLQVWAHDLSNETLLSNSTAIVVSR